MQHPIYTKILLKLSGEVLGGGPGQGITAAGLAAVVQQIVDVAALGVRLGIVIGGGNILRGASGAGLAFERSRGDRMGMLATIINSLALEDALERQGLSARVLTPVPMLPIAEPFSARRTQELLERGEVVIFAGGTGHPYFSTDTAAALRALEMGAQALLKGTKVAGVYDQDPCLVPTARRFERISHREALALGLRVLDQTALSLCLEQRLPIHVFDLTQAGTARRLLLGEDVGTLVAISEGAG